MNSGAWRLKNGEIRLPNRPPPDDRDARVAEWESGVDLCLAWLHFGSEYQRQQQRERAGTAASIVIQQLMMGDVFGMIASRRLSAMGYRTAPTISDGPVPIPHDVFDAPQREHWETNEAIASGYAYERVKVLVPKEATVRGPEPEGPPVVTATPRDRSVYEFCLPVFEALRAENKGYIDLSPEKLLDPFQKRYTQIHRDVADLKPAPQLRTLRTHLTRYRKALRQDSASTSNLPNKT